MYRKSVMHATVAFTRAPFPPPLCLRPAHEHVFVTAGVKALYDFSTAKTSVRSTQSVHSDALIGWPMHTATEVAVFVAHVEVAGGNPRCQALLFGGLLG